MVKNDFPRLIGQLEKKGIFLTGDEQRLMFDAIKAAAINGAVSERQRTLDFIRDRRPLGLKWLADWIIDKSVLDIIGYKQANSKQPAKKVRR